MKYTKAITTQSSTFTIDNSHETWTLAEGQTITSSSIGIFEWSDYHENTIVVNGGIWGGGASSAGIDTFGDKTTIKVGATGTISGLQGIRAFGDQFTLVNNGTISGNVTGVILSGDAGTLINNSSISGLTGFDVESDAGQATRIVNNGTITATGNWAGGGDIGDETLINHGTLDGNVSLWSGNDVFDNRGGSFGNHYIQGDEGNDIFIIDSKIAIVENDGEGTDTVKSTVTMNLATGVLSGEEIEKLTLLGTKDLNGTGNELDNTIKGNSGNNHLSGVAGDDILTGGKGDDIFLFKAGFDHDTITDFGLGADRIDLSDFTAVTSFADLMAHHVTKSGTDLIIHAGTDQLTLEHTAKADLQTVDFIF